MLLSVNRSKNHGRKYRNRNMAVATVFSYLMSICALTVHVKGELALSSETEALVLQAKEEIRNFVGYSVTEINNDDNTLLTTPEIIMKYGYPCESHTVTTTDGYILTLHRIPYGKNETETTGTGNGVRSIVFCQHGLFATSADWFFNTNPLPFLLADGGNDVWIGNFRGNTYSDKHMTLDSTSSQYWDFSFQEISLFDLPASIDYMLKYTRQPSVHYIGHSMGTTTFFALLSERPEYNSKIRSMQAMAPVAHMANIASPIKYFAPFANNMDWMMNMVGINSFKPSSDLLTLMGQSTCHNECPLRCICESCMFLISGYDINEVNLETIPAIMAHTSTASTKTMVHYAELMNSKRFCKKDLGWWGNYWTYSQTMPPNFPLSKVSCPVTLHYSSNDLLSSVPDVQKLNAGLTGCKQLNMLPHPNPFCTHTGYLYATDNVAFYNTVAKILQMY